MKQKFVVEIDSRIIFSERQIRVMIQNQIKKTFEDDALADFSCKVTQTLENQGVEKRKEASSNPLDRFSFWNPDRIGDDKYIGEIERGIKKED